MRPLGLTLPLAMVTSITTWSVVGFCVLGDVGGLLGGGGVGTALGLALADGLEGTGVVGALGVVPVAGVDGSAPGAEQPARTPARSPMRSSVAVRRTDRRRQVADVGDLDATALPFVPVLSSSVRSSSHATQVTNKPVLTFPGVTARRRLSILPR